MRRELSQEQPKIEGNGAVKGLAQELQDVGRLNRPDAARALSVCVEQYAFVPSEAWDERVVRDVCRNAEWLLKPLPIIPEATTTTVNDYQAEVAENTLAALRRLCSQIPVYLEPATLVRVAAYTSEQDSWTTCSAARNANEILAQQLQADSNKAAFIASKVLEGFLRPLFSFSTSDQITRSGRIAYYRERDRGATMTELADEAATKPWKFAETHAVSVFSWAVEQSNTSFISRTWPLFTPVLLALLDDSDTAYKVRGLEISRTFLSKCPGSVLRDTGLGDLLQQSFFPVLSFLPSLTPEDQSVQLLTSAYPAIIELGRAQFDREQDVPKRRHLLGKLLRDGIFLGYWHASQNEKIVEILVKFCRGIVQNLGLAATPYLKDLLPLYSQILCDPFRICFPTCLLATVEALSATMRHCWPRMTVSGYEGEVVKALSICWLSLPDDSLESDFPKSAIEELRAELTNAANILATISEAGGDDLHARISHLYSKDPTLESLFSRLRPA